MKSDGSQAACPLMTTRFNASNQCHMQDLDLGHQLETCILLSFLSRYRLAAPKWCFSARLPSLKNSYLTMSVLNWFYDVYLKPSFSFITQTWIEVGWRGGKKFLQMGIFRILVHPSVHSLPVFSQIREMLIFWVDQRQCRSESCRRQGGKRGRMQWQELKGEIWIFWRLAIKLVTFLDESFLVFSQRWKNMMTRGFGWVELQCLGPMPFGVLDGVKIILQLGEKLHTSLLTTKCVSMLTSMKEAIAFFLRLASFWLITFAKFATLRKNVHRNKSFFLKYIVHSYPNVVITTLK